MITARTWAAVFILLNLDAVLSVMLAAGYALTAAVAAAGTLGLFTAEITVRLLSGGDQGGGSRQLPG